MTRVLVTGGSGFIGTNVVEWYRLRGDQVSSVDTVAPRDPQHVSLWRKVDLTDREALRSVARELDPELVFHLAARTDLLGSSIEDYPANTRGVSTMIETLYELRNLRLAVFASSMLVCRMGYHPSSEMDYCPSTAYGASKVVGEQLVRARAGNSIPWVIVRPTSIWGPWFTAPYRNFFSMVARGLYVHPRGIRVQRKYGFVLNSVAQLAHLAELGGGPLLGRTVYLADYEPIELKDWADRIQQTLKVRPVRELPLWMFRGAAVAGDILKRFGYRLPPMSSYRLNNMLTAMLHDTTPLQSVFPDVPYTLDEAVRITCAWLTSHPL
jgi:nucleoside-diphosphate-sugar epimerase